MFAVGADGWMIVIIAVMFAAVVVVAFKSPKSAFEMMASIF